MGASGNAMRGIYLINTYNADMTVNELSPPYYLTYSTNGLNITINNTNTIYDATIHVIPIWQEVST